MSFKLTKKCTIKILTKEEAIEELKKKDKFLTNMSQFDYKSRIQTTESVTEDVYMKHVLKEVISFSETEIETIKGYVTKFSKKISVKKLESLNFPSVVNLCKTTGKEEGGAAYCRNMDTIVLPFMRYTVFVHEMFHIFSRNNLDVREKLYAALGFQKMEGGKVEFPFPNKKITNPDAPISHHYFEDTIDGVKMKLAPILYSSKKYTGGVFFSYVTFKYCSYKFDEEAKTWKPEKKNGEVVLKEQKDIPSFWKKYTFHVEEILADNFPMIFEDKFVQSPHILKTIFSIIQNKYK